MGKRKSKTSKQKQAKSAKRLAKVFSKKLGISDEDKMALSSSSKPRPKKASRTADKMKFASASKAQIKRLQRKKKALTSPEEEEFRRQQASLVERELSIEWKRNRPKKTNNKKTAPMDFAPASFAATDAEKPTQRLVEEAAAQVHTMQGIGTANFIPLAGSSLQAMAAAGQSWSAEGEIPKTSNPWAVLNDEEEESARPPTMAPASFQFAPASFSLGDNVDPDL